jgi:GntR family transcriptional regulator
MTSSDSSQYRSLAHHLASSIGRGDIQVGAYLPTEKILGEQHGVSRVTVRGALAHLERLGLISRRPRLGTRVESARAQTEFTFVGDSIDAVLQFTRDLPFVLLSSKSIPPNTDLLEELQLSVGKRHTRVLGIRSRSDGTPVLFSEHWIPAPYAVAPRRLNGLAGSIAEFLAHNRGDEIHRIEQVIDVGRVDSLQAVQLQIPEGSAALRTRRRYLNYKGELVLMSMSFSPEGRYSVASVLRRSPK